MKQKHDIEDQIILKMQLKDNIKKLSTKSENESSDSADSSAYKRELEQREKKKEINEIMNILRQKEVHK